MKARIVLAVGIAITVIVGLVLVLGTLSGPERSLGPNSDRKSTRLNSSHGSISYAVFCLKKNKLTTLAEKNNKATGWFVRQRLSVIDAYTMVGIWRFGVSVHGKIGTHACA